MEQSIGILKPQILRIAYQGQTFYGAAQEWYPTFWQRKSGCGPTTTANIFAYLSYTSLPFSVFQKGGVLTHDTMLQTMHETWKEVTPTIFGVNDLKPLATGAKRYAHKHGLQIEPKLLHVNPLKNQIPTVQEVFYFLRQAFVTAPVAFLNLSHGAVPNLDSWHWVLVVAAKWSGESLLVDIYDEGVPKTIDFSLWLATTKHRGGLVAV